MNILTGLFGNRSVNITLNSIIPQPPLPFVPGNTADPAYVARIASASMPPIIEVYEFDTPQADAIMSALALFPAYGTPESAWHQLVTTYPVNSNSDNIINFIGPTLTLRYNLDMGYVIVPPSQSLINVNVIGAPSESDAGPYPVPSTAVIEGWPLNQPAGYILLNDQEDTNNYDGDRHCMIVDPTNMLEYDFYQMILLSASGNWQCGSEATFNLATGALRPLGWTSSDAAGLPIIPAVVRWDEINRGVIDHALRLTVPVSRNACVAPATHYASSNSNPNAPRMGEHLRLKASVDLSGFSQTTQIILTALQRYGAFVADNGSIVAISIAPDQRIVNSAPNLITELKEITVADFEVVTLD